MKRRRKTAPVEKRIEKLGTPEAVEITGEVSVFTVTEPIRILSDDPHDFLQRLIWPMPTDQFLTDCWKQRAVAFKAEKRDIGSVRIRELVQALSDLNVEELLEESRSEDISVWFPKKDKQASHRGVLESIKLDAESAWRTFSALDYAGLYFQASSEFIERTVGPLSIACGLNFAGFQDGEVRGEVECFASKKGHMTPWHTDFQQNFTVQLKGTKTWYFRNGPVESPVRALSPHYTEMSTFEMQAKLVNAHGNREVGDPANTVRQPDAGNPVSITLHEGDTLYHPAGIWHQVTSDSDECFAINFSLDAARWYELVGDAMRHQLMARPDTRSMIQGRPETLRTRAEIALEAARAAVNALTVDDLLPSALLYPTQTSIQIGREMPQSSGSTFSYTLLGALVEQPETGLAMHYNFGSERFESWYRVEIECDDRQIEDVIRHISSRKRESFDVDRLKSELALKGLADVPLAPILQKLVEIGYLRNG